MPFFREDRPVCVSDTECLINYWSIGFKSVEDGRMRVFEKYDGIELDRKAIAAILRKWRVVGFNFKKYDLPMILYAMAGATCAELKHANDQLIQFGVDWWTLLDRLELSVPDFIDYIDLMEVSPGAPQRPSLKMYSGRLHSRKMREMPINHDEWLMPDQLPIIRSYHANDLDTTIDLYNDLKTQLALRQVMSEQYGVDLRSKSDAQIAEAVIKSEVEKLTGKRLKPPEIEPGYFKYVVPAYLRYETPAMQEVLEYIRVCKFKVNRAGVVEPPDRLKGLDVVIGKTTYRMGIGGLHSKEKSVSTYSNDEYVLKDRDVTSYYPMSIYLQGMFPKNIGPLFLDLFKSIIDRRIAAKKAGDKNTAETLKIVLNGTFGKLGSPFSVVYSPNLMIQTTLTGQLAILMLIERLELFGQWTVAEGEDPAISVVSANTDGIVSRVRRDMTEAFEKIVATWEKETGYTTEEAEYESLHSASVNDYVALYRDRGVLKAKRKGSFALSGPGLPGASGQKKNPDCQVCSEAVIQYLIDGTPIEETIDWTLDVRQFVKVRRVNGGAVKDDVPLGKVLRWYYARGVSGGFEYETNGNAVPQSQGAKLLMDLPDCMPDDVDYEWYYREAYAILDDIGATFDPPSDGRTGMTMARQQKAKNIHFVDLETGVALCGERPPNRRSPWVEYQTMPKGHRMCSKCRKANQL